MNRRGRFICGAVAGSVAMLAFSGAASAATPGVRGGFASVLSVKKDTSFAGYVMTSKRITKVVATETVPRITACSANEDAGLGPAVIVVAKDDEAVIAGSEDSCYHGKREYIVGISANGNEKHYIAVAPGDKLIVTIVETSTATKVTVLDKRSHREVRSASAHRTEVEALVGDLSLVNDQTHQQLGVPSFTGQGFSGVKINGHDLGAWHPQQYEWVKGSRVVVKAGVIEQGDDFVTRYH